MSDEDILSSQVKFLERENRHLRNALRDDFAKAALVGYLASFEPTEEPVEYSESVARDCWVMADAMLATRNGPPGKRHE